MACLETGDAAKLQVRVREETRLFIRIRHLPPQEKAGFFRCLFSIC
ncbi:Uncharacterized protein dnm_016180 [Desulfonema magnum]|uniref:Uncharacterized protein n=1 Tax=Desulfonema magnum TaxID=45655 RepID=A0A975BHP2_9BACT|nr:Uncharacterized protein dnm_016180 [Desulfonema magnum]